MARIGLDATYSVDPQPSGIAVYSRKLIEGLLSLPIAHRFSICYRLSRFRQRSEFLRPPAGVSVRLFQEPLTFWLPWQIELFHSLAQRPPAFRFKKEVVTVHDLFPLTSRDYSTPDFRRTFSWLLREAVRRAARVITPSQYTADQLARHLGVGPERVRVVPEGVECPERLMTADERLRERERLAGQGTVAVLSVGVIQTRKNVVNALRALQLLPSHYRLVLVGGNGYGSEAVFEFIRREQLGSRVLVLGHVERARLEALYQASSALVFPSLEEGFGLPVLEAMAHGLPVVASNTASLPEVGGDAAVYVDPNDPRDMAEKLRQVIEDREVREAMVRRGLERVRKFTWRRTAERTLQVYEEILAA